jgi:opacity protein-like surface antigen
VGAPGRQGNVKRAPKGDPGTFKLESTHLTVNGLGACPLTPLVLALVVAPAMGRAQAIRPHFGVGAGLTIPTGDYHADAAAAGEGFAAGWQGLALVEIKPVRSRVGLRVDGIFGQNDANNQRKADLTAGFGVPVDERTRLLGGNVDMTYEFRSSPVLKAYVLAGIGLYDVKLSIASSSFTRDTAITKVGWNVGGGVRHRVGRANVFLEARYCRVPRILDEGRYYKGTFYHTYGIQVQQVGLTAGMRFGGE